MPTLRLPRLPRPRRPRMLRPGRTTYANVMSTLAVLLGLTGGAAYAANTINSSDITNNQVFSADVRNDTLPNGGLSSIDLAAGSVGSSEVSDGSIGADDLGTNSVGFSEIQFGALPQFTTQIQNASAVNTDVFKEIQVSCGSGNEVTGGGFVIADANGNNVPNVVLQRDYAVNASTWLVRAQATSGTPSWQLVATANCIS